MLNIKQLSDYIIKPSCEAIELYSQSANNLLIGTALMESNLHYLVQVPSKIAVGLWQMENATYKDLVKRLEDYPKLKSSILGFLMISKFPNEYDFLTGNLYAACIFARLKYFFIPKKLPEANDTYSLGEFWSRWYNTKNQISDINEFVKRYKLYTLINQNSAII